MQANYKITSENSHKPILVSWNVPQIRIEKSQKPIGKYKKVGKQTKCKLVSMIEQGISIIKASSTLSINYSTAKSILQNLKKQNFGKESTTSSNQESSFFENEVHIS